MSDAPELAVDTDALVAMNSAVENHPGNIYVHLQAAKMFARHNLLEESRREHRRAQSLQPNAAQPASATAAPVNIGGLGSFLGEVDRALKVLDAEKTPAAKQPEGGEGGRQPAPREPDNAAPENGGNRRQ